MFDDIKLNTCSTNNNLDIGAQTNDIVDYDAP